MVQIAWTIPRTWVSGEIVTAANMNTHVRDNLLAISGAWIPYTPTWSGTLGNGSMTAAYARSSGRSINFRISLLWGSTTSHAAANQSVTLPLATATGNGGYNNGWGIGWGGSYDSSAGLSGGNGVATMISGTTVLIQTGGGTAYFTNTFPFTWATGDILYVHGTYEANTD